MHQEKLDVARVVDNESLVAGGHHVPGLLVAAVADLVPSVFPPVLVCPVDTHRRHGDNALEASPDGIVDTLGLAPRRRHALEAVGLVAPEALGACGRQSSVSGWMCESWARTYASSRWGRASLRGPSRDIG